MPIAEACGIEVFATGGLGGVHRGAAGDVRRSLPGTLDISADLEELARTPVNVVCAGPKIILDVQLTLEYLETNGVPLMTLGSDDVPGFYCLSSGVRTPLRVDDLAEAAAIITTQRALGLAAGTVTYVPLAATDAVPLPAIENAGGSAGNVAGALGRLGVPVELCAGVGGDAYGAFATRALRTGGVDVRGVTVVPGAFTLVVIAVADLAGERHFWLYPATEVAASHRFEMTDELADRARSAGWLHVSGAVMSDEPARSTALALLEVARAAGVPTSLDPNIRTSDGTVADDYLASIRAGIRSRRRPGRTPRVGPRCAAPWRAVPSGCSPPRCDGGARRG